jgi:hypothetical protein
MMRPALVATALGAALVLGGCEEGLAAPTERSACWHMVGKVEEGVKFNRLPGNYESLEFCAAALEMVRLQGARQQINGAYQGQFLFVSSRGIFVGQEVDGPRYLALVRTRDGRLAIPAPCRCPRRRGCRSDRHKERTSIETGASRR